MKINSIKFLATIALFPTLLCAQQRDATITERPIAPPSSVTLPNGDNTNVDATDAGAQRPIFMKTENISVFGGAESKYLYRNNPLSSADKLSRVETAMFINTIFAGASFEPVEAEDAVITPYIGTSYTTTEYEESGLSGLDYQSTSAYAMLLAQHSNGWAYRIGISYAMDKGKSNKQETYNEFYPNIGAMKMYALGKDLIGILDVSGGFHLSDSDPNPFGPFLTTDELDNIDITASYGIRYMYENFVFSPRYSLTYKDYTEGTQSVNNGRSEYIQSITLKIDYPITQNIKASLFGGYSSRDSSGGLLQDANVIDYDFESADGGISLGLYMTF
jgi:hypothetical protein